MKPLAAILLLTLNTGCIGLDYAAYKLRPANRYVEKVFLGEQRDQERTEKTSARIPSTSEASRNIHCDVAQMETEPSGTRFDGPETESNKRYNTAK